MTDPIESLVLNRLTKEVPSDLPLVLRQWFAQKIPDATGLELVDLRKPDSGFSGEIYIVTLRWASSSGSLLRKFVVRAQTSEPNSPESDFGRMCRLLTVVSSQPGLPIPKVLWMEEDASLIGGPFCVMEFKEGRVAADSPFYGASGWVFDAVPADRGRMWRSAMQFLANLHGLNWRDLGLQFLLTEGQGATQIERELNITIARYDSATDGQRHPIGNKIITWLLANIPASEELCVSWGDARPGNILWTDFSCNAVLDWEACTLADPASDVGYWLFFDRFHPAGMGRPRLDGIPTRPELIKCYEQQAGRRLRNLEFYELYTGLRTLLITSFMAKKWRKAGADFFGSGGSGSPFVPILEEFYSTFYSTF